MKHLLVLMAVLGLSFAQVGCGGAADKKDEKKPGAAAKKDDSAAKADDGDMKKDDAGEKKE